MHPEPRRGMSNAIVSQSCRECTIDGYASPNTVAPDSTHDFPPVYFLPHTVPHLCYDGVAYEHGAQAPGKENTGSLSGSHGAIIQSFAFFLYSCWYAIGRTPHARQAFGGAGEPPLRYHGAPTTPEMRVCRRCARVRTTPRGTRRDCHAVL